MEFNNKEIKEITNGYLEAMFFTEEEENEGLADLTIYDVANESIEAIHADIRNFIENAGVKAVSEAVEASRLDGLGMDIWYSRNGHGVGFFVRGYTNSHVLTEAANKLNHSNPYIGSDGKIYFE